MWQSIGQLDRILRGEATKLPALRAGSLRQPAGDISFFLLLLAMFYGACLGIFAVRRGGSDAGVACLATVLKMPLLFAATMAVTFPSLYVFTALRGSRLTWTALLRLMVWTLGVMLTVLASLGPIVAFFALGTSSYRFMVLLNVAVCALAGVLGLTFLGRTLYRLVALEAESLYQRVRQERGGLHQANLQEIARKIRIGPGELSGATAATLEPPPAAPPPELQPVDPLNSSTLGVFYIWMFVFMFVGAEMSWLLRPFVGAPGVPWMPFRDRGSGFFAAVLDCLSSAGGS